MNKRMNVKQVENGFLVEVSRDDKEYHFDDFVYFSIDNVIDKLQEVFHQDGK